MFGISYHQALLFTAAIIFIYTCVGGFLAISWIDFFQGSLMLLALIVVPIVVYFDIGSANIRSVLSNINVKGFYDVTSGVPLVMIISLLAWGLGYFGQPHIIVRFMAIKDPSKTSKAMFICMTWMILALLGTACVGILGAAYYKDGILQIQNLYF